MNDTLLQNALRAYEDGERAYAERLCTELLRSNPKNFHALYLMGVLHIDEAHFDGAQRLFAEALKLNPGSAEAFFSRGYALQKLERAAEALICFERALQIRPAFAEAESNRSVALMALKRFDHALSAISKALAHDPNNPSAWNNRGCILVELNRHSEALPSFEKALALSPNSLDALCNYGSALAGLKRYDEAATVYEKTLSLAPDFPYLRGNLLLYRLHACDWAKLDQQLSEIAVGLREGKRVIQPFVHLLVSRSVADQLASARIWAENDARALASPLWRGERYSHAKIRLAYVSADFHAHATAALMAGVFEHHDRSRFQTIAVSYGWDDGSAMRARVSAAFDQFIDVSSKSTPEIASLLRQMEVDIAVDLKGYTQHHRPGLFALRPAPIQVSYLGYPGTMGTDAIDYIIADHIVIPEEHRHHYTEAIAYVPDSYQCNDNMHAITKRVPARSELGLPEGAFVFCCFNNAYKIQPDIFGLWMRLLKSIEGSVLWLLDDNPAATRNLRQEAKLRGVASERLIFAPRTSLAGHLARHRAADLFLDTLPYGAHTTASDALRAGLPVLTCRGETFAGRVSASLLMAVGLPELIADSLDAYETLALKLTRERGLLAELKAKVACNITTAPLFDTVRFTRHLEALYVEMWETQKADAAGRGPPPA